jgi:hypothetical protein
VGEGKTGGVTGGKFHGIFMNRFLLEEVMKRQSLTRGDWGVCGWQHIRQQPKPSCQEKGQEIENFVSIVPSANCHAKCDCPDPVNKIT